ncbi:MAG TPA: hypothetical protein VIJ75_15400 [Hanamia sp.]
MTGEGERTTANSKPTNNEDSHFFPSLREASKIIFGFGKIIRRRGNLTIMEVNLSNESYHRPGCLPSAACEASPPSPLAGEERGEENSKPTYPPVDR